jgi:hypothetical protein
MKSEKEDIDVTPIELTSKQKTILYLKNFIKRNQTNTNALLYYLENIFKNNDEKVDIQFIDNLLFKNNIDVNFCDKTNENALFKVYNHDRKVYYTKH